MLNLILSILFLVLMTAIGYFYLLPVGEHFIGGIAGALLGAGLIIIKSRVQKLSMGSFFGGLTGMALGTIIAIIFFKGIDMLGFYSHYLVFIKFAILLALFYFGMAMGSEIGSRTSLRKLVKYLKSDEDINTKRKILDTSVIIDGRIADIMETGFIEGTLIIPQFVLRELQAIADSPDSVKRNRGRRGLNILRRMQKKTDSGVAIWEQDFPEVPEVDLKLIELAKRLNAKIITNDFNLNKVAQLRGIDILNINELANAMKPVVLPGEHMNVKILKEGKENKQGIAYLDDGTMVVVDDARDLIDQTVKVEVTSVLQTTAGKMIFAKYEEE